MDYIIEQGAMIDKREVRTTVGSRVTTDYSRVDGSLFPKRFLNKSSLQQIAHVLITRSCSQTITNDNAYKIA